MSAPLAWCIALPCHLPRSQRPSRLSCWSSGATSGRDGKSPFQGLDYRYRQQTKCVGYGVLDFGEMLLHREYQTVLCVVRTPCAGYPLHGSTSIIRSYIIKLPQALVGHRQPVQQSWMDRFPHQGDPQCGKAAETTKVGPV